MNYTKKQYEENGREAARLVAAQARRNAKSITAPDIVIDDSDNLN